MTRDPYTVLGVSSHADKSEIKKAYRRLAMKFHPDRNAHLNNQEAYQNNERFKEVNEAYRVLTDKNTNHSFPYNDFGNAFSDPSSYFEDMISSIFEKTYNKKTYNYHRKKENKDKTFKFQLNIIIDLKTALFGDSLLITEKIPFLCKECQGNGVITKKETKCRTCSGYGSVIGSFFGKNIKTDCPTCNGTGVGQEECKSCHGKGYQFKKEELIIDVPYGVQDLEEILVKNDNNRMIITGIINIKEHPLFIRQDNDLILNMSIPYTKALLGGDEDIVILSGEKISLKIPNNIKTGNMLRIKHKGGKNKLGRIGDLYIKFDVEFPEKITRKERKILEKLIKEEKLENYTKSYAFRQNMKVFSEKDKQ